MGMPAPSGEPSSPPVSPENPRLLQKLEYEVIRLAKENIAQAKEIARLQREKANNRDVYTQHQVDTLLFMPAETGPVDPYLVKVLEVSSQGGSPTAQADDVLAEHADSFYFGYRKLGDEWIVFDLGRLSRIKTIELY